MELDKPFLTARRAADLLGVPLEAVVYDIQEGMDGKLGTLTGGFEHGLWVVHAFDLKGELLESHRKRLASMTAVGQP